MAQTSKCTICHLPSTNCCAKCRNVYYCSREHQKADWSRHKTHCSSVYAVAKSEKEGRYLIAQRNIKQGEIILQEFPLVVGPKLTSQPLCLGCYTPISCTYRCSKCHLPMCSAACEESRSHKEAECKIINPDLVSCQPSTGQINPQMYQIITPLRCLSLSGAEKEKLNGLVSHSEKRRDSDIYQFVEQNIVGFIRHALRLTNYDADSIQNVCGKLDTNAFDIRFPDRVAIRGLYPTASLLNHECNPNTRHVFDPTNLRIMIFATRNINKGDKISATYTQTLWNTLSRRNHLMSVKHFWCECRRCADPEEFGTMLSALKCSECPGLVLSREPLNHRSDWLCNKCGSILSAQQVLTIHESIRKQLKDLGSRARSHPELLESFVGSWSESIHPSSCHVLEAQLALIQLYGNTPMLTYQRLTDNQLRNKESYCRQLLKTANLIEPGITQFKGQLQYELMSTLEEILIRGGASEEQREMKKEEIRKLLVSSEEILTKEPHWTFTFVQCRGRLQKFLH